MPPPDASFVFHKAWIPVSNRREIIQWDHAERKVHLEQGFINPTDHTPTFYWDFDSQFWK